MMSHHLTRLQSLPCVLKTQFEAKTLPLVLSVAAVFNSILSLDQEVVKACFPSHYQNCVYSNDMSCALLLLTKLCPLPRCIMEDGQIGRGV